MLAAGRSRHGCGEKRGSSRREGGRATRSERQTPASWAPERARGMTQLWSECVRGGRRQGELRTHNTAINILAVDGPNKAAEVEFPSHAGDGREWLNPRRDGGES